MVNDISLRALWMNIDTWPIPAATSSQHELAHSDVFPALSENQVSLKICLRLTLPSAEHTPQKKTTRFSYVTWVSSLTVSIRNRPVYQVIYKTYKGDSCDSCRIFSDLRPRASCQPIPVPVVDLVMEMLGDHKLDLEFSIDMLKNTSWDPWPNLPNLQHREIPCSKLTVWPWKSPIFSGFTHLPTPMTGRVELLIYWRVNPNLNHGNSSSLLDDGNFTAWGTAISVHGRTGCEAGPGDQSRDSNYGNISGNSDILFLNLSETFRNFNFGSCILHCVCDISEAFLQGRYWTSWNGCKPQVMRRLPIIWQCQTNHVVAQNDRNAPTEDLSQETSFVSNMKRFSPVPGADFNQRWRPRNSELVHTGSWYFHVHFFRK